MRSSVSLKKIRFLQSWCTVIGSVEGNAARSEFDEPLSALLQRVLEFVLRFASLSESQALAVVLWTVHTHVLEATDCTPYLSITSAEKGSGKTRLLEILEPLVARPWFTGRVSPAVLIRKIDSDSPTLLLDESDTAFAAQKEYAETLRGVLNSGYRRSGKASCCVGQGPNISCKDFSTFCPKAIAGIGKLPDTVADRSIPIRLKRVPSGNVGRLRAREVEAETSQIRGHLTAWSKAHIDGLREARPNIPEQLSDRQADCCEPLLAIADLACGNWPEMARSALVELCCEAQADDQSIGVRLLADIRKILAEKGGDRIASAELVNALVTIETSPWAEWSHGKPITAPKLARLLGRYDICPDSVRFGEATRKGYTVSDFADAFARYLPRADWNNGTMAEITDESDDMRSGTVGLDCPCENVENASKNERCSTVPVSSGNHGTESLTCPRCGNIEQNLAAARYHYRRLCPLFEDEHRSDSG
jgi:hypothetical protein